MESSKWAPVVVLVDADHLDTVASDLNTNFERIIGRAIPKADLCHWLDCVALDGGLRPGNNQVQAVFIHSDRKRALEHFLPARFDDELNGKAFADNLGEFTLLSFPVEQIVTGEEFFIQSLATLADAKEVERLIVVGDMAAYGNRVAEICEKTDGKEITLLAMAPVDGEGFRQEVLGYSLMSAMGIKGDEL